MAHFFHDRGSQSTTSASLVNLTIGKAVQLGIWGAKVNGELLVPSCNNPTIATVTAKGTATLDGTLRNITVTGLKEGRVMLEAKLAASGAVRAFTQLVVGNGCRGLASRSPGSAGGEARAADGGLRRRR